MIKILSQDQINQKIRRMAYEIYEQNYSATELYLAGINNNGYALAKRLEILLLKITDLKIVLINVRLDAAKPDSEEVKIDFDSATLNNKHVVLIDDVANTGRTLFYASKPFLEILRKQIQVAVLVNRSHKNFPIHIDIVGLSIATTLKNDIVVYLKDFNHQSAYLK